MIYPYGHVLLPALLHAVIVEINQWKIDFDFNLLLSMWNTSHLEIWKKKKKRQIWAIW